MERSNLEPQPRASSCAESRSAVVVSGFIRSFSGAGPGEFCGAGDHRARTSSLLGGQHSDLAHDCTRIVEIEAACNLAVAHVNHAHASDRELLSRFVDPLVGTAKRPFDGAVAVMNGGAH